MAYGKRWMLSSHPTGVPQCLTKGVPVVLQQIVWRKEFLLYYNRLFDGVPVALQQIVWWSSCCTTTDCLIEFLLYSNRLFVWVPVVLQQIVWLSSCCTTTDVKGKKREPVVAGIQSPQGQHPCTFVAKNIQNHLVIFATCHAKWQNEISGRRYFKRLVTIRICQGYKNNFTPAKTR